MSMKKVLGRNGQSERNIEEPDKGTERTVQIGIRERYRIRSVHFRDRRRICFPDGYSLDLYYAATIPDYAEKQSDLIFDYQNNVQLYPVFQEYLRTYQPKLLAIWGKDDPSFIWSGAEAFRKDLPDARIVPVNSGHFALENCCREIAAEILGFFS